MLPPSTEDAFSVAGIERLRYVLATDRPLRGIDIGTLAMRLYMRGVRV